MSDPENEFPNRQEMSLSVLGYKTVAAMYKIFTTDEMTEIENEALEERKRRSSKDRAKVYNYLLVESKKGNVAAMKEFLDRTEGKVTDKHEVSGGGGGPIQYVANILPKA